MTFALWENRDQPDWDLYYLYLFLFANLFCGLGAFLFLIRVNPFPPSYPNGPNVCTASTPSGPGTRRSIRRAQSNDSESLSEAGQQSRLDSTAATPLVSEQEDDIILAGKSNRKPGKNSSRARRRFKARMEKWERDRLILLQRMGFNISNEPVETLPRERIIQLANKHCLRPQDVNRRHLGVTILDLDAWVAYWMKKAGIKSTKSLFANNKVGVTEEELIQKQFKFFTYGTIFAFKKENDVDTLVFAIQFLPLKTPDITTPDTDGVGETWEDGASTSGNKKNVSESLSDSEKENISFLGKWFHELKRIGKSVKTNRAHAHTGSRGFMIGQGWRAASDAGYSMGLYKTELTLDTETKKKMRWEEYQVKMKLVSEIFNHFFGRLVPGVREAARRFMAEHQLPVLGTLTYGETDENCAPASSLYVSHSNFTNAPHKDNDINPYTFGLWLTTRSDQSVVDSAKEVSAHIRGGQFFFPDYGIAVDFNKCGGMVGITWRAKDDRHATAYTETLPSTEEYMRWGSSIQVAKRTLNATQKVLREGADVRDAEAYQTNRVGAGVKRKQEELKNQTNGKKPKSKNRPQAGSASAYM